MCACEHMSACKTHSMRKRNNGKSKDGKVKQMDRNSCECKGQRISATKLRSDRQDVGQWHSGDWQSDHCSL